MSQKDECIRKQEEKFPTYFLATFAALLGAIAGVITWLLSASLALDIRIILIILMFMAPIPVAYGMAKLLINRQKKVLCMNLPQ